MTWLVSVMVLGVLVLVVVVVVGFVVGGVLVVRILGPGPGWAVAVDGTPEPQLPVPFRTATR